MSSKEWSKYLANGIQVPAGAPVPNRKEIHDLTNVELYLYIEGLKIFQNTGLDLAQTKDNNDPLSYYQIAGIHGLPYNIWPYMSWNKDIVPAKGNNFGGFCTHNSIIFGTWHRPYLALYESTLYRHVNDFANGISDSDPQKAKYVTAAKSFRLPYWDWARLNNPSIFPTAALTDVISVTGPASSVQNPGKYNSLYQAPFSKTTSNNILYKKPDGSKVYETVRYPREANAQEALVAALQAFYSDPSEIGPVEGKNLTERVAYILLSYSKYDWASNNKYQPGNQGLGYGSIEDIHGAIHDLTGGTGGHMTSIAKSAFDPVFWMHHCNIDRLFAIWQALHEDDANPETWVVPKPAGMGDIMTPSGDEENDETPLWPFRDTPSTWYTSNKAKRTEPFGYTYPEIAGLQYPTSPQAKTALKAKIDKLYPGAAATITASVQGQEAAGAQLLPQVELLKQIAQSDAPATHSEMMTVTSQLPAPDALLRSSNEPSKPLIKNVVRDNKYLEWLVNLQAERHSLGGNYAVHIFMGPVQEDNPALWSISPNHIGVFAPVGQEQDTECSKCQDGQANHLKVTGQIPLTLALIERFLGGTVPSLDAEAVVPFLTQNLHWRVVNDGNILDDRSQVAGLTVFVVSNEVTLPESEGQFPAYAPDVTIYPEITTRPDGSGRGEGTGWSG